MFVPVTSYYLYWQLQVNHLFSRKFYIFQLLFLKQTVSFVIFFIFFCTVYYRAMLAQSAVMRLHVVRPSVLPSVRNV